MEIAGFAVRLLGPHSVSRALILKCKMLAKHLHNNSRMTTPSEKKMEIRFAISEHKLIHHRMLAFRHSTDGIKLIAKCSDPTICYKVATAPLCLSAGRLPKRTYGMTMKITH